MSTNGTDVTDIVESVERFNQRHKTNLLNSDTAAALITIEQNKLFLKNKLYNLKFSRKHNAALTFIKDNFPHADSNALSSKLIKIGIMPLRFYRGLVLIISLIIQMYVWYGLYILNAPDIAFVVVLSVLMTTLISVITAPLYLSID